jgi:hypothetical protein
MIWCPKCKAKSVLKHFYDDRCPQCRTVVGIGDALTKDPYQPEVGAKYGRKSYSGEKKKFVFDQPVSNVKSIPTDTLGFYATEK